MIFLYFRRRNRSISSRFGGSSSTTRIGCSASSVTIPTIVSLPHQPGAPEPAFRVGERQRRGLGGGIGRRPGAPGAEDGDVASAIGVLRRRHDERPLFQLGADFLVGLSQRPVLLDVDEHALGGGAEASDRAL